MKSKRIIYYIIGLIGLIAIAFTVFLLTKNNNKKPEITIEDTTKNELVNETVDLVEGMIAATKEDKMLIDEKEEASTDNKIIEENSKYESEEDNSFKAVFDQEYGKVGEVLTVSVKGASNGKALHYSWSVNNEQIIDNVSNQYLISEDDLEKVITATVTEDGEETSTSVQMYISKLPVLYINTENGQSITSKVIDVNATVKIQGNETYNLKNTILYEGDMTIRGRGNSTWMVEKKPYKIKLDTKTDLFGMGKNKNFVLLANYYDQSLMRNMIAYELADKMGFASMEYVSVELVMNGSYLGNYLFCEQVKIAKDRIDILDWEEEAEDIAKAIVKSDASLDKDLDNLETALKTNLSWITSGTFTYKEVIYTVADYKKIPDSFGGYLLELDDTYDEVSKFKTDTGQPIMFKSPEYANTNSEIFEYVNMYIQSFEDAVNSEDFNTIMEGKVIHYSELFDMDSLVDFWLLTEIFSNLDSCFKSTYMYQDVGGLFVMGPIWDFDLSAGGSSVIEFADYTQTWQTTYRSLSTAQSKQWYRKLIHDPYFVQKAYERYHSIRDTLIEEIVTEDGTIDQLEILMAEAGKANLNKWPSNSFWNKNTKVPKYADKVLEVRGWMNKHLTWLDLQFASYETLFSSLN